MKVYFFLFSIGLISLKSNTQSISSSEDSLKFYGDAMFSLTLAKHKSLAEERFLDLAKRLIKSNEDSSLLNFHPSFVITESKDQLIKIISWQIENEYNDYHYCAYLFSKNSKPIFIKSTNRNLEKINYETFNQDNWYGAMYYHFLPELIHGYYTVFGYRFSNEGFKYRIIELLKIENGNVEFGSPLFKIPDSKGDEDFLYRKVIAYSPSANMAMKYDEESKMIYYDHIEQLTDPKSGEILRVPDGTFESFELKNNFWNYDSYHKLKQVDTPPMEKPILDKREKDLFGKRKKN